MEELGFELRQSGSRDTGINQDALLPSLVHLPRRVLTMLK